MKEKQVKYFFYFSSVLLLVFMLLTSRDAGISCDEVLHYDHSVQVYNYFASHGSDTSALNTPVSNLKYYGQSYDNIVTILARWFNIEDVYLFRHLMSAFMGWLAVLITALFAIWLKDYTAGLFVLLLFAVSPTFLGHSQNNLKDIPFAAAYIAGIFFTFKLLSGVRRTALWNTVFLLLSIAFCISIRAGGLLLICYLFFFTGIYYIIRFYREKYIDRNELRNKLLLMTSISVAAYFLSMVLWPYALQNPFLNVMKSYKVMAHFPGTFRQLFEGKVEWSDFMPWYYLLKSMAITIPVVVLSGVALFIFFIRKAVQGSKSLFYILLIFTIIFPVLFVLLEKSNLYSSWRQFLFLYPGLILLAATGFSFLFKSFRKKMLIWISVAIVLLLAVHPVRFMIRNHPYEYIYYNELAGGLQGAYGKYETDYYYASQTEASEWLIDYLKKKNIGGNIIIGATYTVKWQFREHPEMKTTYIRYEERSMADWDYAIVVNRYITPFKLVNDMWPPENAIHVIYADSVPICAILERKTKDDLLGYKALSEGRSSDAVKYFTKAVSVDDGDEMIFYNFAGALQREGRYEEADSVLNIGLKLNPDLDLIYMYLGNIARSKNRKDEAIGFYEKTIEVNRKYFEAYVALGELIAEKDLSMARAVLVKCLTVNPRYKPAIIALGDTYRDTHPDIARKYYKQAGSIN